jgi:hypothetical protein
VSFPCPECGCSTGVVMTRQLIDRDGGTLRRRACSGCRHRFYSLQDAERVIPDGLIEWLYSQPIIDRRALTKLEAQP